VTTSEHETRWGAWILAAAVPFVFLHDKYQLDVVIHRGSGEVTFRLADLALLLVAVASVWIARRERVEIRAGRPVWLAIGALLAITVAACFYPRAYDSAYPVGQSFISVVKFWEYAVLAPAAVILLRHRRDIEALLVAIVAWAVAMTTVGTLQFLGLVNELEGRRPGQREPSYVGILDFAALSVASLTIGFVILAFGQRGRARAFAAVAIVAGTMGLVLAGSIAGVLAAAGCGLGVCVAALLRHQLRLAGTAVIAASVIVIALGVVALRGSDLAHFAAFLGIQPRRDVGSAHIQTYSQRTILAYVGYRVWLRHPIIGSGFIASTKDPAAYMPVIPEARRRFPNVDPAAFPSPVNHWGVQNLYIQALADLGVIGFVALLAVLGAAAAAAVQALVRASADVAPLAAVAGGWLLAAALLFTAAGIVAGIPLDALLWLAVGLAVTARRLSSPVAPA
jgi:O-antigen ligase